MKKVLFTYSVFDEEDIKELKKSGIEIVNVKKALSEKDLIKELKGFDGYICGGSDKLTEKVINSTDKLKFAAFLGTGYESSFDIKAATKKGIATTYTPHANAPTVAEHTIMLILAAIRNLVSLNNEIKNGQWERYQSWNLEGKTVGIIGMGHIGSIVAEKLKKAFNVNILYTSRTKKPKIELKLGAKKVSLKQLLKESDVVSIHAFYSDKTINMISDQELSLMKSTAILVNTSRAELVNPKALYKALKANKLFRVAFDVYYEEPSPKPSQDKYKLLSIPDNRFIITPHNGFNTADSFKAMGKMLKESLIDFFSGKTPRYLINPTYKQSELLI